MAEFFHRVFGPTKPKTKPAPQPDNETTPKASSTTELATNYNVMTSDSSSIRLSPVPQNSRKRKHAAVDLYDRAVFITVGNDQGDDTSPSTKFEIHAGLLREQSGYFRKQLGDADEQNERMHFAFPDHEPEIFQHVKIWVYKGVLFIENQSKSGDDYESADKNKTMTKDVYYPDLISANMDLGALAASEVSKDNADCAEPSDAEKMLNFSMIMHHPTFEMDHKTGQEFFEQNVFDSDPTLIDEDEYAYNKMDINIPPQTQYFDADDLGNIMIGDSPPPMDPAAAEALPEPAAEAAEVEPAADLVEPKISATPSPTVPLTSLTLTKLYILASTLEMPLLCNKVMTLISQRLSYDKDTLINALVYAFARSKKDSYIRRVLIDYTTRFADIDDLLGHAETGLLEKELLVDLLVELGQLRDGRKAVGVWDEVENVKMYKLPVGRL